MLIHILGNIRTYEINIDKMTLHVNNMQQQKLSDNQKLNQSKREQ